MGTPDYAAPEQFRDAHRADPRSDVYSLGCTLYHLIAGREPFPGSSLSEKLQAHETKEPTPLDELSPDMAAGVALVVQRMTAKRPADRFQSMAEVAQALAPHVAASSPSFQALRNTSTWEGGQLGTMTAVPRRRRVPPWLVIGGAVLSLLAVALIGFAVGWLHPNAQQTAQHRDASPGGTETGTAPAADASKSKPSDEPKKEEATEAARRAERADRVAEVGGRRQVPYHRRSARRRRRGTDDPGRGCCHLSRTGAVEPTQRPRRGRPGSDAGGDPGNYRRWGRVRGQRRERRHDPRLSRAGLGDEVVLPRLRP